MTIKKYNKKRSTTEIRIDIAEEKTPGKITVVHIFKSKYFVWYKMYKNS